MRLGLERANRELVVGREEHDRRHALRRPPPDHLEAVDLRHLDVEEDHVGLQRVERREHLAAVAAFADDGEVGKRGEQLPHAAARRRLVVGDEDGDERAIATVDRFASGSGSRTSSR